MAGKTCTKKRKCHSIKKEKKKMPFYKKRKKESHFAAPVHRPTPCHEKNFFLQPGEGREAV
jgi:hypothetical protein